MIDREGVPEALGPYRLDGRLGAGGMGEVYLAHDERLGRRVAVKRIRPDHDDETARERLRREARAVARLSHPSIVPLFDIFEHQGDEWLVMEYVDGPCLADLLKDGPRPLEQSLAWARQIAEGLGEAHGKGLVHRDLKAENVLIDGGRARILDFGLVREMLPEADELALSEPGSVLGTVRAMAPEQALGHEVGPRADLFSLGVLLHEMLSGRSPFVGASRLETWRNILERPPTPLPPEVPADVSALVGRLLEKAPELRPASAEEVARRLEEYLGKTVRRRQGVPVDSFAGESTERFDSAEAVASTAVETPRFARRRRIAAWTAAVVLLVIATGAWIRQRTLVTESGVDAEIERTAAAETTSAPLENVDPADLIREGWTALDRFDLPGRIDAAIELFQRAIEAEPSSAAAHAGLARAYWRKFFQESADRMWLDQAVAVADHAVELDGELVDARISLALALTQAGRIDEAQRQLDEASRLEPGHAEILRGLAEIHFKEGHFEEAESAVRRFLALRPDDWEGFNLLGSTLYRAGRLDEAAAAWGRCIELAPDSIYGYRNLAAVRITQDRLDEAAAVLEQGLAIRPSSPTLTLNLGMVHYYRGLYPQAASAWEQALETPLGANLYLTWANLGDALRQIPHRRAEAPEAFTQAIRLLQAEHEKGSDDAQTASRLTLYFAKAGRREEAFRELAAAEIDADGRALFRLAMALEILGERRRALGLLSGALAAGFPAAEIEREPDLAALRGDPDYHRMRAAAD